MQCKQAFSKTGECSKFTKSLGRGIKGLKGE
jgi:hypothetical protein